MSSGPKPDVRILHEHCLIPVSKLALIAITYDFRVIVFQVYPEAQNSKIAESEKSVVTDQTSELKEQEALSSSRDLNLM